MRFFKETFSQFTESLSSLLVRAELLQSQHGLLLATSLHLGVKSDDGGHPARDGHYSYTVLIADRIEHIVEQLSPQCMKRLRSCDQCEKTVLKIILSDAGHYFNIRENLACLLEAENVLNEPLLINVPNGVSIASLDGEFEHVELSGIFLDDALEGVVDDGSFRVIANWLDNSLDHELEIHYNKSIKTGHC